MQKYKLQNRKLQKQANQERTHTSHGHESRHMKYNANMLKTKIPKKRKPLSLIVSTKHKRSSVA